MLWGVSGLGRSRCHTNATELGQGLYMYFLRLLLPGFDAILPRLPLQLGNITLEQSPILWTIVTLSVPRCSGRRHRMEKTTVTFERFLRFENG